AGVEVTAQESMAATPLDDLVAGPCVTPAADHRHPLSLLGVASDRPFELTSVGFQAAANDRHVGAAERAVFELRRKGAVAHVVACNDYQPGSSLVETVDDAGSGHAADRRPAPTPAEQRMDECACVMAGSGVHDHARGLVEDSEVLVFVDH